MSSHRAATALEKRIPAKISGRPSLESAPLVVRAMHNGVVNLPLHLEMKERGNKCVVPGGSYDPRGGKPNPPLVNPNLHVEMDEGGEECVGPGGSYNTRGGDPKKI